MYKKLTITTLLVGSAAASAVIMSEGPKSLSMTSTYERISDETVRICRTINFYSIATDEEVSDVACFDANVSELKAKLSEYEFKKAAYTANGGTNEDVTNTIESLMDPIRYDLEESYSAGVLNAGV